MIGSVTVTGDSLQQWIDELVKDEQAKTLADLHRGLVLNTPVDTGTARAGWTVDLVAGTVENNVEYIESLNNGHSGQAPAGFVEAEVDRAARR